MITLIPLQILDIGGEGYHLMIKMWINGKAAQVIVDTGASKTVFDKTAIEKFVQYKKFEKHEHLSSGLGTNTMISQTINLKKVKIGDVVLENYTTVLLDLSHVNNSYTQIGLKPVQGVLGSDILLKYGAIIDYEKKVLKLKYKKIKK